MEAIDGTDLWLMHSPSPNSIQGIDSMRMMYLMTIAVSLLAAAASWAMIGLATYNYNPGSWLSVVVLGGWDTAVFVAFGAVAVGLRNSRTGSLILLAGTLATGIFSTWLLYADLHFYFTPPTPGNQVMNCMGPLVELGLPILQWPTFAAFASAGYVISQRR